MKRILLILCALLLCPLVQVSAQSAREPRWPTQGGAALQANFGCIEIATNTLEVNDILASGTDLGAILPERCMGFEARVTFGDIVLAHENNLATGSFQTRRGRLYASGSTILWTAIGSADQFQGYVVANSGTASLTIDICW